MAYRVPRRFIAPPQEPPPYGLFAVSFVGHALFIVMMTLFSAYVNSRADQKVYIVNLVPASPPPLGSPAPRAPEPVRVTEKTPPKPEAPPVKETPPPKPEKVPEAVPPRPQKAEPPPLPPRDVAREIPRPADDFALPRRAEKETPRLQSTPLPPVRPAVERTAATPPPPATARVTEPPRVAPPQAAPVTPPAVAARPGVEATPLGRPDSAVATKGSISLDVSDFPFTYYLRQIHTKIGERWAPPRGAVAGGERVVVLFEIGREGEVREERVTIEKSSGNALYDQAAVRAVIDARPFPPLPRDFKGDSLRVHFGFDFKAEQG